MGDQPDYLPTQHGFDTYFGIPYSMDMLPHVLYEDEHLLERDTDVERITERYTEKAIEFIRTHKDRPLFLWMAHTLPHPPLRLPDAHRSPGLPLYADAIQLLDAETGRLLETLAQLGLTENTLVIFTSDNGPMRRGSAGGLRGGIGDYYEGGIRVPFIASWSGILPEGAVVDTPAIAYDLFPTLVDLAGGKMPTDRVYDGQSMWPLLTREEDFAREAPFIFVHHDVASAIREGRWKLHVAHRGSKLTPPQLFDLSRDPEEAYPVNDPYPEVVARLQHRLRLLLSRRTFPRYGVSNTRYGIRRKDLPGSTGALTETTPYN